GGVDTVDARGNLVEGGVAEAQQQVVYAVDRARTLRRQPERARCLDVGNDVGIEQRPQFRFAEKIAQLRVVDRQRLCAVFGQRRVAVIEIVRDVAEQQARGKRRRRRRIDRADGDRARLDGTQRLDESRDVEDIAQNLAVGFEQDGERPVLRG